MTLGNLDVARDLIGAVNRRDFDAFRALLREDVEWDDREGWPGIQGVEVGIEEITEGADGSVFLQVSGAFRGGSSGVPTEIRACEVLWITAGLVAKRTLSWSRDEALAEAGLS